LKSTFLWDVWFGHDAVYSKILLPVKILVRFSKLLNNRLDIYDFRIIRREEFKLNFPNTFGHVVEKKSILKEKKRKIKSQLCTSVFTA
jgi:hypothetical protein